MYEAYACFFFIMTGELLFDGTTSTPFNITSEVKQRCVIASVFF